jgi:hypothetical protein
VTRATQPAADLEIDGPHATARPATAALLWAAANPFPRPSAIRSALDAEVDTDLLGRAAVEQWVAPLVWHALNLAGCAHRVGAAAGPLRANAARASACAHFLPLALELGVAPLTSEGLQPLVLKGAALAGRYPDLYLRPMGDIDVLLPRDRHRAAIAALQRAGWSVTIPITRLRHDTTLMHPDVPTLSLELHAGLDRWFERSTRIDDRALWHRRRPATLAGTEAYTLAVEDELIVLAAHAGKPFHCFDRLLWFADLAVVIGTAGGNGGVDWDLVMRRAREQRASTVMAVALAQARRAGAEVPPQLLEALPSRGWRLTVLAPLLEAEWPLSAPDDVTRRHARYALCETWPRRLRMFVGETPYEPLRLQPALIARRIWMASFGLQRLRQQSRRPATRDRG